ncbi:cytochrome c oxidase subunit II [Rubellimicrobium arenae]|uniref:cytochrome c oxidase subunit II n=1 Tax=Rubellimicrobium arenae TaxID=2817372 RepID=UPI001B30A7EB|nr:c-type cytochrome [Rubellimicrobium arenae]
MTTRANLSLPSAGRQAGPGLTSGSARERLALGPSSQLGCWWVLAPFLLTACDGPQSALSTGGADAAQLDRLFTVMLVGAVVLWLGINGLFLYATRRGGRPVSRGWAEALIIGGGIGLPVVVLTALLSYGLSIMPDQRAVGEGLRLRVTGEEFWWRVEYWPDGADAPIVAANEIRLPVGQRTEIELASTGVIHSLWLPALGGKTDMIPGRINRMSLHPTQEGLWRGQCAEFCGLSHALMALQAVAMEEGDFRDWLAREAAPAGGAGGAGAAIFAAQGCGACHAVRGTGARGAVGPDLTHLGARGSVAAGILPMTPEAIADWIRDPAAFKPGVRMPAYAHLPEDELTALADWLWSLK